MLQITIPPIEGFKDETNEFIIVAKEQTLQLEHSLVSLSKWEARWNKPFLVPGDKPYEESIDYIRHMTLTQNIDSKMYDRLTEANMVDVMAYIEAPMTATTFSKDANKATNREIITNEIIYWWMITLNIPFECQKWHLNRLLTLINVCNIKNKPARKMSAREAAAQQRALNESRKAAMRTGG